VWTDRFFRASPVTLYTMDAEANKELAASLNDALSKLAREYPEKISCMATVPLQDPAAAAMNLRGQKGGAYRRHHRFEYRGHEPERSEPGYVLGKGHRTEPAGIIHPINVCGGAIGSRIYTWEIHWQSLDTSIAVACLIFGGVLDRYPNLRFYLSHMGGFVPWIAAAGTRLQRAARNPRFMAPRIQSSISEVLLRYYHPQSELFRVCRQTWVWTTLYSTDYAPTWPIISRRGRSPGFRGFEG